MSIWYQMQHSLKTAFTTALLSADLSEVVSNRSKTCVRKKLKGVFMKLNVTEVSRIGVAMRCLMAIACLFLFALSACGQNGYITGTITDSSGAVAPNVAVEAKNSDTGAVFQGGTSSTGNYVISVPAGKYQLTVSATGFKKYVRSNIVV